MTPKIISGGDIVDMYISTSRSGTFVSTLRSRIERGDRLSPSGHYQVFLHAREIAAELKPYVIEVEEKQPSAATN